MKSKIGVLATLLAALALAMPAAAHEGGKWILRGGVGMVSPKSDNLFLGDVGLADESVIESSYIQVDDAASLVLSATYMINDNWAVDILGAVPFDHDIDLTGTLDGSAVKVPVGSTKHLPPTVSVQYHFAPDATFQPYVGLGVNYTTFMDESVVQSTQDATGLLDIKLDDSSGVALQLGADWVFGDNWLVNFDARWIQIKSDLTLIVEDGNVTLPELVEINPWVLNLTVGYRF